MKAEALSTQDWTAHVLIHPLEEFLETVFASKIVSKSIDDFALDVALCLGVGERVQGDHLANGVLNDGGVGFDHVCPEVYFYLPSRVGFVLAERWWILV